MQVKSNLGLAGPPLRFAIGKGDTLQWCGESDVKDAGLLAPEAKAQGVHEITLRRAKARMGCALVEGRARPPEIGICRLSREPYSSPA
jgi:hypothetical protein